MLRAVGGGLTSAGTSAANTWSGLQTMGTATGPAEWIANYTGSEANANSWAGYDANISGTVQFRLAATSAQYSNAGTIFAATTNYLDAFAGGIALIARTSSPIIFASGGTATTNEVGRFIAGTITFGTGGSNTFSLDTTNARLNIGSATTTAHRMVYAKTSFAGTASIQVENTDTGTVGSGAIAVRNSAAAGIFQLRSTGFTTAGISVARGLDVYNSDSGPLNISANSAAIQFCVNNLTSACALFDSSGNFILRPTASITPAANGDLAFQATSNTSLTFKLKGSDGTVRSGSITLS